MILKTHLLVSARKLKMAVSGFNNGRSKLVEKKYPHSIVAWHIHIHKTNAQQVHHFNGKWNREKNLVFEKYTASYLRIVCYEVFRIGSYVDSSQRCNSETNFQSNFENLV